MEIAQLVRSKQVGTAQVDSARVDGAEAGGLEFKAQVIHMITSCILSATEVAPQMRRTQGGGRTLSFNVDARNFTRNRFERVLSSVIALVHQHPPHRSASSSYLLPELHAEERA